MRTEREPEHNGTPGRSVRPTRVAADASAVQRAVPGKGPLTAAQVAQFQGTAGNAAVVQRLAHDGGDHAGCGGGCGHAPAVQRSSVTNVIGTPGQRFDGPLRKEAESVYGVDLSHLRVHTDAPARQSAQDIGAEAYTAGHHMVFDGPMTRSKVLHEVAHTFQQAAGPVSGNDNGGGLKVSDPNSPEERQASAMENATAPTAALQRLLPTAATPAVPTAAEAPVQRMFRRSHRSHTQRDSERILIAEGPRTDSHGRTRAGGSSSRRRDPLTEAARVPVPRRGPDGEALWDGTRRQLTWTTGTEAAVLAATHSRLSSRTNTYRYECQKCGDMVLSRSAARSAREDNWYEIDHVEGILAYVHRSVDPMEWSVEVGENIYRDVTAISLEDARNAASDPSNLRVLCRACNGGRRAANSESRHMDRYGPQWTGLPYQGDDRRSASPEVDYNDRAPAGSHPSPSYSGARIITVEPGGRASADPGYDVVTVEPRRRY